MPGTEILCNNRKNHVEADDSDSNDEQEDASEAPELAVLKRGKLQ